jgi:hypothetical protein
MCYTTTTKQPTYSPRSHLVAAWCLTGVFTNDQHAPSIRAEGEKPLEESEPEVIAIDQPPELNLEDPDWCFPILKWLVEGKLPPDQTEARRIAHQAKAFVLIDDEL